MPIMCIYRVRKATAADYDEVRRRVRWEESPPPGGIAHFISFANGGCVQMDVWESRKAHEAFWTARMTPVLRRLGIDVGEPEILELHGLAIADAVAAYQTPRSSERVTVMPLVETDALA